MLQRANNVNGFKAGQSVPTPPLQSQIEAEGLDRAISGLTFNRPVSSKPQTTDVRTLKDLNQTATTFREEKQETNVPKYVQTEKQVLRFYCHFFEIDRNQKRPVPSNVRLFTLLIYLEDVTCEIIEDRIPNSGIQGGTFFGRGKLNKSRNSTFEILDFDVGSSFIALGQEFLITDCDAYTREYYRYYSYI
jgi:hypothetical protein